MGWFDGERNQSPRKTQEGWRLGNKRLHDTREGAEAEVQREMVKNGDRVTKVHDLPDDMNALKKIRSAHHPDRNPDADGDLYQADGEALHDDHEGMDETAGQSRFAPSAHP